MRAEGGVSLSGPIIVAAFTKSAGGEFILSRAQETTGILRDYSFDVLAGENLLIAWSGENDNIEIDTGDYLSS